LSPETIGYNKFKRKENKMSRIDELEAFVKNIASNYDCDEDAHKYNTPCRCCDAKALLK
jgi:hypothetical protein